MASDQQARNVGSTSQNSGGAAAGVRNHNKKMALHARQIKGQGATTGGFATSPGESVTSPSQGKFYAKGKN